MILLPDYRNHPSQSKIERFIYGSKLKGIEIFHVYERFLNSFYILAKPS